ncbi:bacterial Ig-like domain-containing protein [Enterococcus entomosocium]|uniref:bacterial Ig-like domain-containing protein n=1 Tax=Enterococcus entomosocium TaxID=3034352 RepID=UPI003BBE6F51
MESEEAKKTSNVVEGDSTETIGSAGGESEITEPSSESSITEATESSQNEIESNTVETEISADQTVSSSEEIVETEESDDEKQSRVAVKQEAAQHIFEKGTLLTTSGEELSRTEEIRLLNNTPVTLQMDFELADEEYAAESTVLIDLPQGIGFSDTRGGIEGVDASWQVNSSAKQLTITFNQAVQDASFTISLKSYLYTESTPQITVNIGDTAETSYSIDLYENLDPIKYVQKKNVYGLQGEVYYNLDRNLSGLEILSLDFVETPGAKFKKTDVDPLKVYSYDVDIKGNVKYETQVELFEGVDYTILSNDLQSTKIEIKKMDKQKAYSVSYNFIMGLAEITDYSYKYNQNFPTSGFGAVSLLTTTGKYGGPSFFARTSADEEEIAPKTYNNIASANLDNGKGSYSLSIHTVPTEFKKGQQLTISTQNEQEITINQISVKDPNYERVDLEAYFKVENSNGTLILTAIKDSILSFGSLNLGIPFNEKDIIVNVTTPLIPNQVFKIIGDDYVEPITILNNNNAETAWGNYNQNGAYTKDTSVNIEGSVDHPIENAKIFVANPSHLTLRKVPNISFYYTLDKDYTIEEIDGGTLVTFTTPITHSIQFDLGFNYVPDSLPPTKSIPVEEIPVSITADGIDTMDTTVKTSRKLYSEYVLQSSKNQFLINARQDTISDLKVETHIPKNTDVTFSIIDVSNDQVDGIYPQYWDRGYYNDQAMDETNPNYPTITYDEETNYYTFDFGTTNRRYIIAYNYANGWQDASSISIPGYTNEPLFGNNQRSANVTVSNTMTDIIGVTQATNSATKNMTQVKVTTKNIDHGTKKVKNPTFLLKTLGNTNGEIDVNSIKISNVPEGSYKVQEVNGEVSIVFSDYILTDNIEISYNVLSQNAGQISASGMITSETIDTLTETKRTAVSDTANLQFSSGDSEGIIYMTNAAVNVFNTEEITQNISGVSILMVNQLTGDRYEFETNASGVYDLSDVYTGKYKLYVASVPDGYVIPENIETGMDVQLGRNDNTISVGITPEKDQSTVVVKDSTLYVGDTWSAADNFVSATDKQGNPLSFSAVTVSGDVDTSKEGSYEVTYTNGTTTAVATITVVSNQATVVAKDSTIYVGDKWEATDNFVSATDKTGKAVTLENVVVSGTVDTTTAGQYEVVYQNGNVEATATITVLADETSVQAKDSTLYVGDTWSAADNFVSATDKQGNPLSFSAVTVSGDVDTSKEGSYEVTYTNGTTTAVATITVVSNQATVVAKDSTIYVGDKWEATDNFVSATDKTGKAVTLENVVVSGTVDTTTAGQYEVVYQNGNVEATATITVLADETSVQAKDSTLYVGDTWSAADNFVSATDKQGNPLSFSAVTVSGDVDTSKEGSYEVTYTNGTITAVATITVVSNQTTVVAKDSTIYVGDKWEAADNFVSATDKTGKAVTLENVVVSGTVDTTTAGQYEVVYQNGNVEATATITVLADETSVQAKDSTLYVGDTWSAADNFVSATDKQGNPLSFSAVTVSGDVDTSKEGSYEVTYTNGTTTAVATITVVSNQATVVAKDSTIYVGDKWEAADNFVSATDKTGKAVTLENVVVSGTVDTTTAGQYEVVYQNGNVEATATITVLADETSVQAKDSTLYVGDTWSAADNFVSATDKQGNPLSFSAVTVSGDVDTSKEGSYEVTYTNGTTTAVATITVVSNQATVVAKDSTIYVGDKWEAADNFVSATDKTGKAVTLENVVVSGTVDTTTAGQYEVVYQNGNVEATATITVLADETSVQAKDSTLYVGDTWSAADNFVSATDKQGNPLSFSAVTVSGDVDTSKEGSYEVTYTNGTTTAVATITVVSNQATIVAKDSTIYVGDKWEAKDNFVNATDKEGIQVPFVSVNVIGTVDTTTAGQYEVVYQNGNVEATATVTVLADETSVQAKDSTLYVGDTWSASDNFVSATDKQGNPLSFSAVTVSGDVDTSKEGSYEVTYTNGTITAVATITVVSNQTTVVAKDSTIYVGDKWEASDNFISATDKTGKEVVLKDVIVSGTVDTTKAGQYEVLYQNGNVSSIAVVTVREDLGTVVVKDSVIYVGEKWEAKDNFVSATDKNGQFLDLSQIVVEGTVDTKQVGTYQVKYSEVLDNSNSNSSFLKKLFGTSSVIAITATAKIKVIEKATNEPIDNQGEENTNNQNKQEHVNTEPNYQTASKVTKVTSKESRNMRLPKTGSTSNLLYQVAGVVLLPVVGILFFRNKKRNKEENQ